MYMMSLRYRIILLIVIKNPVAHLFFAPGAAPYPAVAFTAPLRPPAGYEIPTFKCSYASTVSPASD